MRFSGRDPQPEPALNDVALGDIVVLPDGRHMTVRSRAALPEPVGTMGSFLIAGEMDVLLGVPNNPDSPVNVYLPADFVPPTVQNYTVACEGAASYYAPHLPMTRGAMGEILFRMVKVRGSVDPVVLIYRGQEMIVFLRATYAAASEIGVQQLRRDVNNDLDQVRVAARIVDGAPAVPATPQLPKSASKGLFRSK